MIAEALDADARRQEVLLRPLYAPSNPMRKLKVATLTVEGERGGQKNPTKLAAVSE